MIEGDGRCRHATTTIGAHRTMLLDEPPLGFRVGGAARGCRGQLGGGGAASPASSGAFSWYRHSGGKFAAGVLAASRKKEVSDRRTTDGVTAPR